MAKVILLSQIPLPYTKIGSWPTLYSNYFKGNHQIDFIICPKADYKYENIVYSFVKEGFVQKIFSKITNKRFSNFNRALQQVINPNEKYIIQVVDNFKIIPELETFLRDTNLREQCYLQFFYHGFAPFPSKEKSDIFFHSINEMVVLTHDSYKKHLEYYNTMPTRFSVLHNGIDTAKFFKVTEDRKSELREKYHIKGKNIFIWCSQDRPKKGLDFILDVWKRVYSEANNMELLIIGNNRNLSIDGVRFLGRIPNDEIAEFYQLSDVYLFPSLWQEGFGLTLVEALHSGCYCIASKIGGIPEVLQYGKYGKLIENPHFLQEWVDAIQFYVDNKPSFEKLPLEMYSKEEWCIGMNAIITSAKKSLL